MSFAELDCAVMVAALNRFAPADVQLALHNIGDSPLRGHEHATDLVTEHGDTKAGYPEPGMKLWSHGGTWRLRITQNTGPKYTWDELSLSAESAFHLVNALVDRLAPGTRVIRSANGDVYEVRPVGPSDVAIARGSDDLAAFDRKGQIFRRTHLGVDRAALDFVAQRYVESFTG